MIVGLVSITPAAGYVNGLGALVSGAIASTIVWFAWTYLQPIVMRRVDDAMGVVYTHGLAGLCGGLLVGIFADPTVVVYPKTTSGTPFSVTGWLYGNRHEFFLQLLAALTIIVWDALVTFLILKGISLFTPLRMPDAELEVGDLAVHGEEAYPLDEGVSLVGVGHGVPSHTAPVPERRLP
jgi:Amt family ammonium transporter